MSKTFDSLEHYPFCKVCVGGFDKGSIDASGNRTVGQEYIWCRGLPRGYEDIEGVTAE